MKVREFNKTCNEVFDRSLQELGTWFSNLEVWQAGLLIVGIVAAIIFFIVENSSNSEYD